IYHPVGTAMLVAHADRLGREVGVNGVWGNLGVASSALVTGVVCQYLGWRWAFVLPGLIAIAAGIAFAGSVRHGDSPARVAAAKPAHGMGRASRQTMARILFALAVTIVASSTTF